MASAGAAATAGGAVSGSAVEAVVEHVPGFFEAENGPGCGLDGAVAREERGDAVRGRFDPFELAKGDAAECSVHAHALVPSAGRGLAIGGERIGVGDAEGGGLLPFDAPPGTSESRHRMARDPPLQTSWTNGHPRPGHSEQGAPFWHRSPRATRFDFDRNT